MDNNTRMAELAEDKYVELFGVSKTTFVKMLSILNCAYDEMRKRGGFKRKLSVLDMLVIFFDYYHDYRTMQRIGFDYDVHKQRISEAVKWVEQTLIKDGTFALPSKRELVKKDTDVTIVIIDATEQETERPKKNSGNPTLASKNAIRSKTKS
jgi:hypothetical protein